MNTYLSRIMRAARLDVQLYEEVEADKGAMGQAVLTVVLSSIAAGSINAARAGLSGVLIGILIALIGWFIWAFLVYIVGTKLLPETDTSSDIGELLRTIGFSSSPGLIRVFGIIPGLEKLLFVASAIWMLFAMVIAVRQALDYKSTGRAVWVCVIGWAVQILITILLLSVFVGTAAKSL